MSCCFLYKRSLKLTCLESDLSTRDKFFPYQRGFSIRVLLAEVLLFASGSPKRAPYWPAFKLTKSVQRFSFFWNLKLSICSNSFFLKRKLVVGNCYRLCKGNYKCCRFFVGRECYLLCHLTPTFKSKEIKKLRSPFCSYCACASGYNAIVLMDRGDFTSWLFYLLSESSIFGTSFFPRETMNSLPGTNKLAFTESGMRLFLYLIKNKPDTSYTRVISWWENNASCLCYC